MRLGIARTFQINQLFADLTPIETLGLAISERHGSGGDWWRLRRQQAAVTDEIAELVERFRLADVMHERTAMLPYGKQRLLEIALAFACRPRVLLLDEPAAGVPEAERHEILATIAALPADVTVLLIEHDMDIVFSFADRISVLVNGALFVEGAPEEVARDPRVKAVYLGEDVRWLSSAHRQSAAGYGEAVVLSDISLDACRGPVAGAARPQRHGQDHADQHHRRRHPLSRRHHRARRPRHHAAAARQRAHAGIGWVPQERNIFRSLTVHENLTAVALPGRGRRTRVYAMFPRLAERKANLGNQLSGGEQQMLAVGRALVLNPSIMLLDEPLEGLAPIIVEELLAALRRIIREEGMSAILVEQNPQKILGVTDHAMILERGCVVHAADSATLAADRAALEKHLGVTDPGRAGSEERDSRAKVAARCPVAC